MGARTVRLKPDTTDAIASTATPRPVLVPVVCHLSPTSITTIAIAP